MPPPAPQYLRRDLGTLSGGLLALLAAVAAGCAFRVLFGAAPLPPLGAAPDAAATSLRLTLGASLLQLCGMAMVLLEAGGQVRFVACFELCNIYRAFCDG